MSLIQFINKNLSSYIEDEIIFFGGSFNPWHKGHTECIKLLPQGIPIVILPDNNPFKQNHQNKERMTSLSTIE